MLRPQQTSPQQRYFDRWAARYDRDLTVFGYAVPQALLDAVLPVQRPVRLLDIGIGTGLCSLGFLSQVPGLTISGVDVSTRMLHLCPFEDLHQMDAGVTPLPFADGAVDTVISGGAIEFMPDLSLTVAEAARVLSPGGVLALAFETPKTRHFYQRTRLSPGHVEVQRLSYWPWPHVYSKYLHAPDALRQLCALHGLMPVSHDEFAAYRRPNGQIVTHDVMMFRKAA